MESGKTVKLSRSLRFSLAFWLSALVLLFGAAAGTLAYLSAQHRVAKVLDEELLQVALYGMTQGPLANVRLRKPKADGHDMQKPLLLKLPVPHNDPSGLGGVSQDLPVGFQNISINGVEWRVLVFSRDNGERYIASQRLSLRAQFAKRRIVEEVFPYLLLTVCIISVTLILISHFLSPIQKLAAAIDNRSETDLTPIPVSRIPSEILVFVTAINRLLSRIARSSEIQRRFVADAAHELRLPLTAISLQAEGLGNITLSKEANDRLAAMRNGVKRGQALINQLLAMARAQENLYGKPEPVVVSDSLREVLENLLPDAEAKDIDLGLTDSEEVSLVAPPMAIQSILKNLLENAIRYTPEKGRIDVRIRRGQHGVVLSVEDSGPGIPENEWDRACDPFYRCQGDSTLGSGLGLAIVKTIAESLGGHVLLGYTDPNASTGLSLTVFLPM